MLCEKIIGKVSDSQFAGREVDYVDFEWHEERLPEADVTLQ